MPLEANGFQWSLDKDTASRNLITRECRKKRARGLVEGSSDAGQLLTVHGREHVLGTDRQSS